MFSRVRTTHRWVALLLLTFYGSAGVLGYGLHELFHVHHRGQGHTLCSDDVCSQDDSKTLLEQIEQATVRPRCSCLCRCEVPTSERSSDATSPNFAVVEDACLICQFLTQAQQPVPTVSTNTLVTVLPAIPPAAEVIAPLFLPAEHLARGPPAC